MTEEVKNILTYCEIKKKEKESVVLGNTASAFQVIEYAAAATAYNNIINFIAAQEEQNEC